MEQFPERKHLWLWAAFVLCLLFIPSLFSRGPWHVDDLRYAEVARQMGEYGNYLVPHINGRVYGEKPPGFFWFVVGIQKLTGVSYLAAARLLAALSTVATCGILVALGRLLFRRVEIGLIGAMVFATFIFVIDRGQRSLIDPFLVPLTTGAVLGLLYAAVAPETKKRMLGGAAACLLMALACMTKGPVGLIIPLLGALALGITWRGRQGVSIKWLVAGVVFGGAVTLLWLWLASQDVGQWYWDRMFKRQTVERATESWHHAKPFYYFLGAMPDVTLPWLILLPGAALAAWRARRDVDGRGALGVGGWALAGFIFFSVMSGKRTGYLLPLYAPLGLFIGWGLLRESSAGDKAEFWLRRAPVFPIVYALMLSAAAIGVLALVAGFYSPDSMEGAFAQLAAAVGPLRGLLLAALGAFAFYIALRGAKAFRLGSRLAPVLALVSCCGLFSAVAHLSVVPAIDEGRSAETLGHEIALRVKPGESVLFINGHRDGVVNYYLNTRSHPEMSSTEFVESDRTGFQWLMVRDKDWKAMPENVRSEYSNTANGEFNNKSLSLLKRVPGSR